MAKSLRFKVVNCKAVSANSLMVFDLAVGYEENGDFVGVMDVRGCWLKQKKDGSGNFISFPSKLRVDKSGEAVVDDNGYKVYDNIVDIHMALGANPSKPDTRAPTEAAWAFRKWLIDEATRAYESLKTSDAGRGPSKPRAAASKAETKAAAKPAAAPTAVADEYEDQNGDDDFPF
jgi:3D (Asp-Asp-Asp) domain-containing protein